MRYLQAYDPFACELLGQMGAQFASLCIEDYPGTRLRIQHYRHDFSVVLFAHVVVFSVKRYLARLIYLPRHQILRKVFQHQVQFPMTMFPCLVVNSAGMLQLGKQGPTAAPAR